MTKRFLIILILIFNLSNFSFADDIRDFQIEGMGIGDSALDFFPEEVIKNNIELDYYKNIKNKKFYLSEFYKFPIFKTYDALQVVLKTNDN